MDNSLAEMRSAGFATGLPKLAAHQMNRYQM
jgi:hypothetical protein